MAAIGVVPSMRATVCQLPDDPDAFEAAWRGLGEHVEAHASDLVLLPEMPAGPWFCVDDHVDPDRWQTAIEAHAELVERFGELGAEHVVTSRPAERGGRRVNQAVAWTPEEGIRAIHEKRYLPDEDGWREARWYQPGTRPIEATEVGEATVGTLVCTDVMFNEHARAYGRDGAQVIVVPRASEAAPRWPVACRMAAVAAGAYVLSSNRAGPGHHDASIDWGGQAMVVDPDGHVLACTTEDAPFATVDVDLDAADAAKEGYPRYVDAPGSPTDPA